MDEYRSHKSIAVVMLGAALGFMVYSLARYTSKKESDPIVVSDPKKKTRKEQKLETVNPTDSKLYSKNTSRRSSVSHIEICTPDTSDTTSFASFNCSGNSTNAFNLKEVAFEPKDSQGKSRSSQEDRSWQSIYQDQSKNEQREETEIKILDLVTMNEQPDKFDFTFEDEDGKETQIFRNSYSVENNLETEDRQLDEIFETYEEEIVLEFMAPQFKNTRTLDQSEFFEPTPVKEIEYEVTYEEETIHKPQNVIQRQLELTEFEDFSTQTFELNLNLSSSKNPFYINIGSLKPEDSDYRMLFTSTDSFNSLTSSQMSLGSSRSDLPIIPIETPIFPLDSFGKSLDQDQFKEMLPLTESQTLAQDLIEPFIDDNSFTDSLPRFFRDSVTLPSGGVFTGEWNQNNERHGKGVLICPKGGKYEGYWRNDQKSGKGRLVNIDGDIYLGEWLNDKAHGKGVYITQEGSRYEGSWQAGKRHGKGKEVYSDRTVYEGDFEEGMKSGSGKIVFSNGCMYEGDILKDNINGTGVYIWEDGKKYIGKWENNRMHGKGSFEWADGRSYVGEYRNDEKHGWGVFRHANGNIYGGEWHKGKKHGEGVLITKFGERKGHWKDGKRVK